MAVLIHAEQAKALFAGVAAPAFRPLASRGSSAIGVALATAAHAYGWPVAKGGSGAIVDAMLQALDAYGARVVTGVHVTTIHDLPEADIVMLNTAPGEIGRAACRGRGDGVGG